MATKNDKLKQQLQVNLEQQTSPANSKKEVATVKGMLGDIKIKKRFEELLGKKAQGFMSSIINVVNSNTDLKECDANTVIGSAAIAASLDLPIDPNLGFAYIIPYNIKSNGVYVKKAQFQLGYKGFVQLAMRTGQYKTISATPVYEGEIIKYNRITSEIEWGEPASEVVVGYIAYFKLLNGFEKYLYMSKEEVKNHAKKHSKTFESPFGIWSKDFDSMATKTVLKRLLSKFGMLSIEMNSALLADQAVITAEPTLEGAEESIEYIDATYEEGATEGGNKVE